MSKENLKSLIELPQLELPKGELIANEIHSLPEDDWYWIKFHGAWMCSLYNARSDVGWLDLHSFNKNLPEESYVKKVFEDVIFPFLGGVGNITVIKTNPGEGLNDHIDCAPTEAGTMQYKFRWVVEGDLMTLYFFDQDLKKVFPEIKSHAYLLNGAHPHGMRNNSLPKLTICVGAPWQPNETFLKNVKDLPYHHISYPNEIKNEWNDPRFFNENKIGMGITEFKKRQDS